MGFPPVQHRADMHGVALTDDQAMQAIAMLAPPTPVHFTSPTPAQGPQNPLRIRSHHPDPPYAVGKSVAVRSAFGDAMVACGDSDDVVVIDGDVNKSMYTDRFAASYPERFVQTFISEQQMLGTAVGLSSRGFRPVVSTYAAFLTRAFDFIRMAVVSESDILVAGSHAGVEIGRDGPSQMALEDLAMMRSLRLDRVVPRRCQCSLATDRSRIGCSWRLIRTHHPKPLSRRLQRHRNVPRRWQQDRSVIGRR